MRSKTTPTVVDTTLVSKREVVVSAYLATKPASHQGQISTGKQLV